jgi:bacterial/archaeal transporter family-2 protein
MSGLILLAIVIGLFLPLQSGINAQLRTAVGDPVVAALISFAVGSAALLATSLALRVPLPAAGLGDRTVWWHWTGGLLGAFYIFAAVVLAPRLGAAALIAAIVAGQMLGSLVLDHYGLVGYAQHAVNLPRVAGAVLVIAGVLLIQRY